MNHVEQIEELLQLSPNVKTRDFLTSLQGFPFLSEGQKIALAKTEAALKRAAGKKLADAVFEGPAAVRDLIDQAKTVEVHDVPAGHRSYAERLKAAIAEFRAVFEVEDTDANILMDYETAILRMTEEMV